MPIASERAADAVITLLTAVPALDPMNVWFRQVPGAFAMATGVPFPTLNGVWAHGPADPDQVDRLLDELPAGGLGYCLQARDPEAVRTVAQQRGLVAGPEIPLMTLAGRPTSRPCQGLRIREVERSDFDARTAIAAAGFEVPADAIRAATRLVGRTPGYRMYIGEVQGRAVTTAVGIRDADWVGIFDVATPPEHRGHGYGAAITAHAVTEGYASGATWAWLQSSPEGYGVYERLGFRTVEQWALWLGGND